MGRNYFLWERTHTARKGHSYFCDRCCEYIFEGQRYTRKVWVFGSYWRTVREHTDPECSEYMGLEVDVEETLRPTIRFTLGFEEKVVRRIDGTTEVISVPKMIQIIELTSDDDGDQDTSFPDDDIPF